MLCIEPGQDYDDVDPKQLPFTLVQSLGHGHSGNVEEVKDKNTQKSYARKTIRVPLLKATKAERSKVFRNEVAIIRSLGDHTHIVRVHATYVTREVFGILLEPVASHGDLEMFLADYWHKLREFQRNTVPSLPLTELCSIIERGFGCLAEGLAFMHEKRIRHKDIKPRNILVHEGRMLYTDFGYSFDSNGFTRSTTEGRPSFLTRRYSAYEVLEHEQRNSKSDVFSLGCVYVEMLSALTQSLTYNETGLYSECMDDIHDQLRFMTVPLQWAILPSVITSMTLRERHDRPTARQIRDLTTCHISFSCSDCFRKALPDDAFNQGTDCDDADSSSQVKSGNETFQWNNAGPGALRFTPWIWSEAHGRHYSNLIDGQGQILNTLWSSQNNSRDSTLPTEFSHVKADNSLVNPFQEEFYGNNEQVQRRSFSRPSWNAVPIMGQMAQGLPRQFSLSHTPNDDVQPSSFRNNMPMTLGTPTTHLTSSERSTSHLVHRYIQTSTESDYAEASDRGLFPRLPQGHL